MGASDGLFAETLSLAEILTPKIIDLSVSVLSGLGLLFVGWFLARLADRLIRRSGGRTMALDETLRPFLASLVRYGILVVVFVAAMAQFGIETTSLLAVLGAAGLAIGLALQGTLSNIAAGVMLLFLRPLKVGEFIDADGVSGAVEEIGLFTTILTTGEGLYLSVPNARLWGATIKNFSRRPRRLISVNLGIDYAARVEVAREAILSALSRDPRILETPKAEVRLTDFGDNALILTVEGWTGAADYLAVRNSIRETIKSALDATGIAMPFPQRVIHVMKSGPTEPEGRSPA